MRDILGSKPGSGKTEEQTFPQGKNDEYAPRAMVSSPDGTQRPIEPEDVSIPKFETPHVETQSADITPAAAPSDPEPDPAAPMSMGTFEMRGSDDYPQPEPQPVLESNETALATTETTPGEHRRFAVEELQHMLEDHDLWLQTSGQQGKRANFSNANLQYVILSGCALNEVNFHGADLSFADLSQTDLRGADLGESILQQTSFAGANLAGAAFARSDMRTANLEGAYCEGTDFTAAGLIGANLSHLNLSQANFEAADLQSASLYASNLQGAFLRSANLTYANLQQADLSGAQCINTNFNSAVLDYAAMAGTVLTGAVLHGASLTQVDISQVIDLPYEFQQGMVEQDRAALEQQWTALRQEQQKLEQEVVKVQQRETNVQMEKHKAERIRREAEAEKNGMDRLLRSAQDVMREHYTHDRMFRYIGVMWFVVGMLIVMAIILFLNALELGELNGMELAIVLLGCAGIMALAAITIRRSIKLSNNLKRLLDVYEQGFGALKK